ncbi:MAG: molybdate ABC transporter substrate-binding protein [bacterium]
MTRLPLLLLALTCSLVALSPAGAAPGVAKTRPITIYAAASLSDVLTTIGHDWSAATGSPAPVCSFDASSRLAKQIAEGAPADLFISADEAWMDFLADTALIDSASRTDLVGNTLVCVVNATDGLKIEAATDLTRDDVGHIALAGETVPAGKYAQAALKAAGVWDSIQDRIVRGDNVRTVLAYAATGEVDAAVVYATDARVEPKVKLAFTFPEDSYPRILYPAALIQNQLTARPKAAASFLDYLESDAARDRFAAAGFTILPRHGETEMGTL